MPKFTRLFPFTVLLSLGGFIILFAFFKIALKSQESGEGARAVSQDGGAVLMRPEAPYRDDTPLKPAMLASDPVWGGEGVPPMPSPLERGEIEGGVGDAGGTVNIVLFCDHISNDCREAVRVLREIVGVAERRERLGGRPGTNSRSPVQLVWKDFPSPLVPGARPAAIAARCAQNQGKFWEFHDMLAEGVRLKAESYAIIGQELGMDIEKFNYCLQGGGAVELVNRSIEESQEIDIDEVPGVFVGPYRLRGEVTEEKVKQLIILMNK